MQTIRHLAVAFYREQTFREAQNLLLEMDGLTWMGMVQLSQA
jgi:hypothetical protein